MSFNSEYLFEKKVEPMCQSVIDDIKSTGSKYHLSWDGCKFMWVKDESITPPTPTPPTISLASPQAGIYEIGDVVDPVTLNATVVPGTNPVTSIDFFNGVTNIQSGLSTTAVDNGPFTSAQTWGSEATDGTLVAASNTVSITFVQPYFWGTSTSLPVPGQSLINTGNKVIGDSTNNFTIDFNSGVNDYIWFAIPQSSQARTSRYIDVLNNGNIGTPADLFGAESIINVDSPDLLWNNIPYRFYLSNYQTQVVSPMELRSV